MTKLTKSCKGKEAGEDHDCPSPEVTLHTEDQFLGFSVDDI